MEILLAGILAVYIILELCKKVDERDETEKYQCRIKDHSATCKEKSAHFVIYSNRRKPHKPDSVA